MAPDEDGSLPGLDPPSDTDDVSPSAFPPPVRDLIGKMAAKGSNGEPLWFYDVSAVREYLEPRVQTFDRSNTAFRWTLPDVPTVSALVEYVMCHVPVGIVGVCSSPFTRARDSWCRPVLKNSSRKALEAACFFTMFESFSRAVRPPTAPYPLEVAKQGTMKVCPSCPHRCLAPGRECLCV